MHSSMRIHGAVLASDAGYQSTANGQSRAIRGLFGALVVLAIAVLGEQLLEVGSRVVFGRRKKGLIGPLPPPQAR